jgi:hypothetical protein
LKHDPQELNDVYGHPDYAEVTARLKATLRALKTDYEVPDAATEAGPSRP